MRLVGLLFAGVVSASSIFATEASSPVWST